MYVGDWNLLKGLRGRANENLENRFSCRTRLLSLLLSSLNKCL